MSFQSFPIWANILIFAVAAVAIWYAGTRLEHYTDAISRRTQLGKAFLGLLLLSTATGLPEIANQGHPRWLPTELTSAFYFLG